MHSAKDDLSVDETVSTVLDTRVTECTCYKIVKPLFYDHSNLVLRVVVKEGFYCILLLYIIIYILYILCTSNNYVPKEFFFSQC